MEARKILEELVARSNEDGRTVDKFVGTVALVGLADGEREKQLGNDGEIIPNEVGPVEKKIGVLSARWKLEMRTERNEEGGSHGRGKDKAVLSTGERAG